MSEYGLPWTYDQKNETIRTSDGSPVCGGRSSLSLNSNFDVFGGLIVRAVNSYKQLLGLMAEAVEYCEQCCGVADDMRCARCQSFNATLAEAAKEQGEAMPVTKADEISQAYFARDRECEIEQDMASDRYDAAKAAKESTDEEE